MYRIGVLVVFGILLFAPTAHAQVTGCVRQATQADVDALRELNGATLTVGTCLDQTIVGVSGLDAGALEAKRYLESQICPGFQRGYNASIPAAQLKEQYVYFSAPGQGGMDPKFMVCMKRMLETPEVQAFQPCISAALRTQAHQQASCMDPSNRVVCGRTSSNPVQCRADFSTCPHVNGLGMDLRSKLDASGGSAKINELAALVNSRPNFGIRMGLNTAYDPWHSAPFSADCRGPGQQAPPSPPPPPPGLMQPQPPRYSPYSPLNGLFGQPPPPLYPIQPAYAAAPPPSALNAFTEQRANPLLKLASTSPLATTSLIADRLEGLAFSTTSATSSGVRFIPLVISGAHAVGNSYGGNTPAPTSTVAGGSISQQTFTSRDLQYQPTASSSVSASTYGRLVQLYTQLRDVLARMLSLLRPFSVSNAIEAKKQQQLYGF